MKRAVKKRLALAAAIVATLAAVATLVGGVSFGLFSSNGTSGANTFTAGTVTVGPGSPSSVTCTIPSMVPGDSSAGAPIGSKADTTCTYNMKYTGSASAWLGVDVTVTNGSTALYDGTATGLQLYLKAGSTTFLTSTAPTAGTTYTAQGGTSTSLSAGTTTNLLVSTTAATTNTAVSFTLDYALPIATGNTYQGGSATVTLTFHAVQSADNPLPSACAAGQQCNPGSSFVWS
jgi:hypothetical protein